VPAWIQISRSICARLVVSGLAMPSMKPSMLRGIVPLGRAGLVNPSMRHSACMPPLVCLAMSRSAYTTTSELPALS
jgi:hypothetical protein